MDPGIRNVLLNIVILILLVLTNAFFAMSEIAILQSNQNRTRKLAEEGNKRAARLLKITAEPSDFLATIQVGVTLSGFLASAVAADKFAGMLSEALAFLPIAKGVIEGVSLVVITLILSYFTLVFGELVPKRVALKYSDQIALKVSGVLGVLYRVLKPIIRLLAVSTNGVSRLMGIREGDDEEPVTQEDILMMVEEGEEKGEIQELEMQMIQNIFKLDEKTVSEAMTHRTEITMVSDDTSVQELLNVSQEKGYSRIPVYHEDFDDIVGIVYVKDLIGVPERQYELPVGRFIRKPIYVPEGKLCSKLLLEFQENRTHMAIVIDEYGGTAGLVTLEDLLEIIVGNIQDESDHEPTEVERVDDKTLIMEGDLPLEEVEETLEIEIAEDYDCDTLGGYIMAVLGHIPTESGGERVSLGHGYLATVEELEDRRISRVRILREEESLPADSAQVSA